MSKTDYEMVVGLEVHAELSTDTKIYCSCKNSFGSEVNSNCCEVCTGMPGTLPTLNRKVVDYAIKMGHALHCKINNVCKQDRKNYFYPDLPKAYQISQFDIPLCEHGYVDVILDEECHQKRIGVTRIHIEEDAGKLIHDDSFSGSLVDFNRCGVPLIEIVSEPDLRSPQEAKAYLDTIRSILQYLDISDCKMQEGSIRCDVNVSVRKCGSGEFGTRCEMKNVNSFSGAMRAIEYEANRQIEVLESGGTITQETRRWDDQRGQNFLLRSKEDAQDYRYFPEPDLLTIVVPEERVQQLREEIPELPGEKLLRYVKDFGLPYFDANLLCESGEKRALFEEIAAKGGIDLKAAANWLNGDITRILNEKNKTLAESSLSADKLIGMISMIEQGTISNTAAKTVLEEMFWQDKEPSEIVEERGLGQINDDSALQAIVGDVLQKNEKVVTDYKNGKTNALGFLVGQCMRATKGQGNPAALRELLLKQLG
ncbi:MAG: Asp-tRNA(Asn)/Glu-tRNA(Gln) amidotransferase subunit GatB [Clostridiales bacterium]|uniref:Asp-tRNA(Asn)/Glu-tRNA(Gln) amidotransferase subunit GatB n=1 Tax=Provencibacterium massiliense TaxID=1841868 RepID=UPI0009A77AA6|nr:Asp-tRNA(Asn)/Glu-tRNA(Gln) amidotransferase subunit GatB [Provencibacterium massiliense]PWM34464.1 MAG: Asp-tRNA(Asn)/Glu-tRNA(Gln) amidotransferase subunit GatB [Clostridiales bacterium]RGB68381.1 Asp-tRNA(Asn)/Glu-tRNA(Gln) amidotransferase subunit GatB [Harryflintia acetispora]